MKNNVVTRIDKKPFLMINPELERELPPLSDAQLTELRKGIERDGVLDAVKYWINVETGQNEIIDGHNRHRIAQELKIDYPTCELEFQSIEGVKYWMHRNNAGRRDGKCDRVRMAELLSAIKLKSGLQVTKAKIIEEVAKDTNTSIDSTKKALQRSENESKPSAPKDTEKLLQRILRLISSLSDTDRAKLFDAIEKPSG